MVCAASRSPEHYAPGFVDMQVKSHTTGRYVRLLSPTPELWTLSLKHRTQIVHELDQSFVIYMLGLKPGGPSHAYQ